MRLLSFLLLMGCWTLRAQTFVLPTPNDAIFHNHPDGYFVPTVGKTWESGTFGCVRTDGRQMHEGLDIKCLQRDKHGEPADPVFAAAPGKVVYLNDKPSLSNYGRYIIVQHKIEGLDIFTIYAHLKEFDENVRAGSQVAAGQRIGTMGRSTNTHEGISKERGHLHFEINLRLSDHFTKWHDKRLKGQRNDHGEWNGRNFLGLDPRRILLEQQKLGKKFSLLEFIRNEPELCRVVIRQTNFDWLNRYTPLVLRNPVADKAGVAGYEVALNFNGIPFKMTPRSTEELQGKVNGTVLGVNAKEQQEHPCRKLVIKRNGKWELGKGGQELIDLVTF